jgi:outer membrane protein assembly factor BamB
MAKKLGIAVVVVVVAFGVFRLTGMRFAVDGSGMWPRFWSRTPNYDELDADRAQQRRLPPLPAGDHTPDEAGGAESAPSVATVPESSRRPSDSASAVLVPPAAGDGRARGYWPDFRGINRDGRYDEGDIRTDWPADGLPRLWKQPIGVGYASFVVANRRAFTIEQRRAQEVVAAYDVQTGREIWTHGWDANFVESMGGDGPRATPTYDDGRIYALGAEGELRCLDARTGALVWRHNILSENDAANLSWGMAASPLVVDDKIVVLPGGRRGKSVVAYHKGTGSLAWSGLDDPQAYTSPMLVTLGGVRQLLIVSAKRIMGLAPDDGRLLWEYPWETFNGISVAQPLLLGHDRIFISAAYGHGAAAFEVVPDGDRFTARTLWQNTRMKNKFSSSVLRDGFIYGLDEAILACIDAATGELKWKGGRYGYGQIMLVGDFVLVLSEEGEVALVRATPEHYDEVARFAAIDGKTWNYPVIADGRLLVRNIKEMAAFDIRPQR